MTAKILGAAKITVLVCDDDIRICDALREVLDSQPDLEAVAVTQDAREAAALAERHRPMVAIVDVRMPGGGAQAVRGVRERSPNTRILAFSAHNDNGSIDEMRGAGAQRYLVKGTPIRQIIAAVRELAGSGEPEPPR